MKQRQQKDIVHIEIVTCHQGSNVKTMVYLMELVTQKFLRPRS